MRTTDNNGGSEIIDSDNSFINLSLIANRNLVDLQKENPDLLIFPQSLGQYRDDVEKSHIFSLEEKTITTYNLMGFVGRNETQLTISSRFAKSDDKDYFLHYMLQKVFSINLLKFDQTGSRENIWDFLLYLFPYFLKKAYTQGMYKAYKKEEYNDPNVRGTIDVKRHIARNIPFAGKIAYSTRVHSYDNPITQLVRHTVEYIKTHPFGAGLLTSDIAVRNIIGKFNSATQNSYSKNSLQKVIFANLRPISHPYFTEYRMLQKICLQILRREKLTYGVENNKVYGLLFDGAWLWEEYLNTILKNDYLHPENKTGKNRHYLFENFQSIYPDFISKGYPKKVGDAKYIPLGKQQAYGENSERAVSIYYKTIAYMYRFNSNNGFLLFPNPNNSYFETYKIKETDGVLKKIGLAIPQAIGKYTDFINKMNENELELIKKLSD